MKKYRVYYMRSEWFRDGIMGDKPDVERLENTHTFVKEVRAQSLDDLFTKMQAFVWSPNGEARELIESLGLHHTSMSVGDIAIDEDGGVHLVRSIGWEKL